MNILGVGPAELLLIFIIALIVFGPGRLPELARTLGKAMSELRRMSLEITAEFTKELQDVEAISREMKETTETIKQAVDIEGTLVESVEPAPPSAGPSIPQPAQDDAGSGHRPSTGSGHRPSTGSGHRPSTGSGHRPSTGSGHRPSTGSGRRTAGEPREEPGSSDVEETTTQAEAEKKDTAGMKKPAEENEIEGHERKRTNDRP